MKVTVKYQIIDPSWLDYGMFQENGEMIPNKRITQKTPIGGTASNIGWLKKDIHHWTDEIKELFPEINDVEYTLVECERDLW